jgi:hypothetical protein
MRQLDVEPHAHHEEQDALRGSTYIVRTDISPGTYRSRAGGACYWARLRSFTGSTSAIISNDNVVGSTIVTIRRTDRGFHSHGCATWTRL